MRSVEVIDTKKESDPPGRLVTNGRILVFSVGAGKEKSGLRAGRPDDHPAFWPSIVGERRRVLDEVESEYTGEECDGWVVLVNDQGNQVDLHPGSVRTAVSSSALPCDDGGRGAHLIKGRGRSAGKPSDRWTAEWETGSSTVRPRVRIDRPYEGA
jgi:hypothetical protein